jgi:hypothetical protein
MPEMSRAELLYFQAMMDPSHTHTHSLRLALTQMPEVSRAELLYFQAMMDVDGNGKVSYQELVQTAKLSMEAAKKVVSERLPR